MGGMLLGGLLGTGLAVGGQYLWDRYGTGIMQGKEALGIWNELSDTEKWVIGKLYDVNTPNGGGKSQLEAAKDWLAKKPEERQAILNILRSTKAGATSSAKSGMKHHGGRRHGLSVKTVHGLCVISYFRSRGIICLIII